MPLLAPGVAAPPFNLLNPSNSLISLDQYRGKWVVIYFYPKAMTPGCTTQARGLRDSRKLFDAENVVILGVSPDKPEALQKFATSENLNFTLLSDANHTTAESYGVWQQKSMYGKSYMGIARTTYIVDPEGKVVHLVSKVNPATHSTEILKIIKGLKHDT